ncbi:MAG: nucleotide exchange factor GrpE [Gemmatimonadetes bacterium]|nr:nucleotide exchange factor GrpE [Gemmatimonadota bacterium]
MTDRDDAPADTPPTATEEAAGEAGEEDAGPSATTGPGGDAEASATTARAEGDDGLADEADHLQAELQTLNDRHLRLAAEFQNYRRRAENEMTEAWARAQSELLRRFLDVLDDLQRVSGLDPAEESVSVQSIVEGVDLVERKFLRTLEEAGVEVIDPEGEGFDPETMEALMRVPADAPEDDDRVQQVFQKGYRLKGHLVRPARVSVLKHG